MEHCLTINQAFNILPLIVPGSMILGGIIAVMWYKGKVKSND